HRTSLHWSRQDPQIRRTLSWSPRLCPVQRRVALDRRRSRAGALQTAVVSRNTGRNISHRCFRTMELSRLAEESLETERKRPRGNNHRTLNGQRRNSSHEGRIPKNG